MTFRSQYRYKIQYAIVGQSTWTTMYDSQGPSTHWYNYHYELNGLMPKTRYQFVVLLHYPYRDEPYVWPRERDIIFETAADKPAAPGRPIVTKLRQDVYKVSWEAAKDNGAIIEEYALEVLVSQLNRAARFVLSPDDDTAAGELAPGVEGSNGTATVGELETYDERWSQVYNGTDVYWIIPERHAIQRNLFRVRARNSYGWGPYSDESRPTGPELYVQRTIIYIATFVSTLGTIVVVVALTVIFCKYCILMYYQTCTQISAIMLSVRLHACSNSPNRQDEELSNGSG